MSPEQLALVADTHALVAPTMGRVARDVHARMIEADPTIEALLPSDRNALADHVARELSDLVAGLARPDGVASFRTRAGELGAVHRGHGVAFRHYAVFGPALADALAAELGDDWSPEAAEAWRLAFALVAQAMLDGAH